MKKVDISEIQINQVDDKFKASLKSRIIVALILIAIMLPCAILGNWPYFIAISVAGMISIWEVCASTGKKYGWWVIAATYIITACYIYWPMFKEIFGLEVGGSVISISEFFESEYFNTIEISTLGVAGSIFVYFAIAIFDKNFSWSDVAHFSTFTLLIGLGIQSLFYLRYSPFSYFTNSEICSDTCMNPDIVSTPLFKYLISFLFTMYGLVGACLNDTFAYFGGVFFGKHKLNERISPKKTWEGFIIGIVLTAITMSAIGLILAATGYPILPFLNLKNWYWIVILSILIPLIGDLGDLSLSLIKRQCGIKDYGNILKGHGGILDRGDSIFFVAIICAIIVRCIVGFHLYI